MLEGSPAKLFISIVTPSFNQALFIKKAISSVEKQDYKNYEHLIVDGMSTDGTISILKEMNSRNAKILWISERDNGQSAALNKGFIKAKGDIIGWLNSDDVYKDSCFSQIVNVFDKYPDVDIIYGDFEFIDKNGDLIRLRHETEFSEFVLLYHRVLHIATIAAFFRRRIFDEGNLVNEDLHYAMDLEFLIRLVRKGYVIKHVSANLASYRLQPKSKTCSDPEMFKIEHLEVVRSLIPLLRKIGHRPMVDTVVWSGRVAAASVRYAEKLLRGYYWSAWRAKYSC